MCEALTYTNRNTTRGMDHFLISATLCYLIKKVALRLFECEFLIICQVEAHRPGICWTRKAVRLVHSKWLPQEEKQAKRSSW